MEIYLFIYCLGVNLQKDATSKPRPQLVAPISQQKSSKSKFAILIGVTLRCSVTL